MSNLLDKASIVTTPTAYDNGKILSVKPNTSVGDFDFTRNSSATRVNSQGLIEDVQILSSNLVSNGDFATDSDWGKLNATISGGTGNLDGDGQTSLLYQNILTNGKTYKVTFTASDYNGLGEARVINSNGAPLYVITSNGTFTFTFTHSHTSGDFLFRARTGAIFSVDNISVMEITEDTNLPRIDYTGGVGHWLFEPQSTNLVTYSSDFSNASWVKSGLSVTDNTIISPDGTLNAAKLVEENQSGGKNITGISFSASTTNTFSVYAKASEREWILVYFNGGGNGGYYFDVKNGVIGTKVGSNTGTPLIEDVGNGWYRCSITHLSSSSSNVQLYIAQDDNVFSYQGDGTSGLYTWGAQLEQQSFATSYIPTNGSTVTRLQDAAFGAGSSDLINSTEGVLYAEIAALANDLTNKQISLNNGTTDDRIQLYYSASSNQISVFYKSQSGASTFILNHTLSDITQFNKVAFKWKQNDFALWSNGVEVATQTSGVTSSADTLTKLDFQQFNGSADFFGKTKCVAVFKEALTDAELTCLTTI